MFKAKIEMQNVEAQEEKIYTFEDLNVGDVGVIIENRDYGHIVLRVGDFRGFNYIDLTDSATWLTRTVSPSIRIRPLRDNERIIISKKGE